MSGEGKSGLGHDWYLTYTASVYWLFILQELRRPTKKIVALNHTKLKQLLPQGKKSLFFCTASDFVINLEY